MMVLIHYYCYRSVRSLGFCTVLSMVRLSHVRVHPACSQQASLNFVHNRYHVVASATDCYHLKVRLHEIQFFAAAEMSCH